MPGVVKVKIIEGRNLPVMDRSGDTTDAFVELKLGNVSHKTEVCRKTLNPLWNSEWYRFEVDDTELQDEPLQLRIMDHDTYSANDMIGKVYFNLNPLLLHLQSDFKSVSSTGSSSISGWFPVYDTMQGVRGEIYVMIKLDLFSDHNKYRQSSCGVHLFYTNVVPYGYNIDTVYGFVEELVVEDDPEYQWIEKIRTPRASNEARQTTFYKMSGELQRKIGLKVIELGGNAIIGYRQCFDLEGESGGVVVRGIGTAVKLIKNSEMESESILIDGMVVKENDASCHEEYVCCELPDSKYPQEIETDVTVSTDKLIEEGYESVVDTPHKSLLESCTVLHKDQLEMMAYPFFTLSKYPDGFIQGIGGTVSARSVKLLGRVSNIEEPETRDAWWTELRIEIKSHMKALACNAVLNYVENTSICDEVCILSASGTAAVVKINTRTAVGCYVERCPCGCGTRSGAESAEGTPKKPLNADQCAETWGNPSHNETYTACSVFHIPYRKSSFPFPVKMKSCCVCRKAFVPDMLFATIDPLNDMLVIGQGAFVHAFAYRLKKDYKTEMNAREISDGLPFLEYELNRQLVNKLRVKGMNSLFGLNVQISVGEKMILAYATGTGLYLSPLPPPPELSLTLSRASAKHFSQLKLEEWQKKLQDTIRNNKIHYRLQDKYDAKHTKSSDTVDVQDLCQELDLYAGFKQTCIIELDDEDDIEMVCQLIDPLPMQGFLVSATEDLPGVTEYQPLNNIQLFAQIWRSRIPTGTPPSNFNRLFYRMVQGLYCKVHSKVPCSLNKITFKMDIPEPDELQICTIGMAMALTETGEGITFTNNNDSTRENNVCDADEEKDFDPLPVCTSRNTVRKAPWDDVDVTSLSYIPDGTIKDYLGNLSFIFIRETSGVKEGGGVNSFVHNFLSDVISIVKSHVMGVGGNSMVGFFLNECSLITHKNQGQCLVHVGGDAVYCIRNKNSFKK